MHLNHSRFRCNLEPLLFELEQGSQINPSQSNTLELFDLPRPKRLKPQIASIPGIPLKEKYRYRVTLGHQVLGDKLSFEQAAELAGLKVKGVKS